MHPDRRHAAWLSLSPEPVSSGSDALHMSASDHDRGASFDLGLQITVSEQANSQIQNAPVMRMDGWYSVNGAEKTGSLETGQQGGQRRPL